MFEIPFPSIETKFHRCLVLDNKFHTELSNYLKETNRDFISLKEDLHIACDYFTKDGMVFKVFLTKLCEQKPNIIKMGNVILFSEKGFTILPCEAFNVLFGVK